MVLAVGKTFRFSRGRAIAGGRAVPGTKPLDADSDEYRTKGVTSAPIVGNGTWRIENEEGAWQGSYPVIVFPDHTTTVTSLLIGEGAYEGLTAIWESQHDWDACTREVRGLIIAGEMPAAREPFMAE